MVVYHYIYNNHYKIIINEKLKNPHKTLLDWFTIFYIPAIVFWYSLSFLATVKNFRLAKILKKIIFR